MDNRVRNSSQSLQSRDTYRREEYSVVEPADVAINEVIQGIGNSLNDMEIVFRDMKKESMKEYLQLFMSGVQTVIDNLVMAIDTGGKQAPKNQIVFDVSDMSDTSGDHIISGIPASKREMLYQDGSRFVSLEELEEQDLDDMVKAIRMILTDAQATLLDLSDEDIDELSEAMLLASRIVIMRAKAGHKKLAEALNVTLVEDNAGMKGIQRRFEENEDNNLDQKSATTDYKRKALWEPIAPKLFTSAISLAEEGKKKPATALLLASVMLPFAWMPILVGSPILATDALVQWAIGTKFGQSVDQGAFEALQVAQLGLLLTKVGARQSLRFVSCEFQRIGGFSGLAVAGIRALMDPVGTVKGGWTWANMIASGAAQQFRILRNMRSM